MENELCSTPLVMASRNSPAVEGITQNLVPKPLIYCNSFDLNNQNHIIEGIPILSGDKGEPTIDVHVDGRFVSPVSIVDSNSFVTSQGKTVVGIVSNHINNNEFEEHLAGGRPSDTPLAATRIGVHEYLGNSATFSPSVQALGPDIFNSWQDTSNHLPSTFGERGYGEVRCNSTNKWNVNKFPKALEVDGTEIMAYSSIGNMVSNGWTSSSGANLANIASYHSSNCNKELSLSLTRSPTVRSGLEQPSCSSKEIHKSLGSNKHIWFSPATLGSRFRAGIQEIFAQIATYSFENLEGIDCSAAGVRAGEGSKSNSAFTLKRKVATSQNGNSMFEAHVESPLQRNAAESNKSQLLMLLQLVDNRYSECLDEIHTVASAFHAATELDPQMHARFALGTISLLYKDLRERISNHILAMGSSFNSSRSEEEKEWCIGTSFIRKQWVLQQVKRKDQLWRPQRGLPERSVSVLRAWMFQNFLHPYPKDAEKHLLAVKSGLTRSQVSNWFINARVRLWKPMIEEMYAELNRRKDCRNEEGLESTHKRRLSMNNQMLNIN